MWLQRIVDGTVPSRSPAGSECLHRRVFAIKRAGPGVLTGCYPPAVAGHGVDNAPVP